MYRILLIFMVLLPFVSLRAVTYIGIDAFISGAFPNCSLITLNRTSVLFVSLYACMRRKRDISKIIIYR